MATRDVFSEDELVQLRGFPEPARAELIRYFTVAPADELFVRKFRGRENVMGVAVQLCTLPWLGYVPDDVKAAPAVAVARLSEKLGIPVGELRRYGAREQTRTDHLRDVAAHLGWRQVDSPRWKDLEEFLFARAMEHDSPKLLFRQACEYLSSSRLVRGKALASIVLGSGAAIRSATRPRYRRGSEADRSAAHPLAHSEASYRGLGRALPGRRLRLCSAACLI